MRKEYGKHKITLYGKDKDIEHAAMILDSLPLTGIERHDRLLIQNAIDEHVIKADILYDGNTVYGYKKLAAEIKRMKKSGSIEKISDAMYKFLSMNFDIAYYDKNGYVAAYDGQYSLMLAGTSFGRRTIPGWESDVARIAECF